MIEISKFIARGYAKTYGGSWAKGKTKEEALKRVEEQGDTEKIDLYEYPEDAEVKVRENGSFLFKNCDDEDIKKIE